MWWQGNYVKITHLPTGISAKVEVPSTRRSMWAARRLAMNLIAAKVESGLYGPQKLVRSYVIPDKQDTISELETGSCVDQTSLDVTRPNRLHGVEPQPGDRNMVTRAELLAKAAALGRSTTFPPLTELCNLVLSLSPDSDRQDEIDHLNGRISEQTRNINELKATIDRLKAEMKNMVPRRSRMSDEEKREYKRQYMRNYRSGKPVNEKDALKTFVETVAKGSGSGRNEETENDITEKSGLQVLPERSDTNNSENC